MKFEREEIIYIGFWFLIVVVMVVHIMRYTPEVRPVIVYTAPPVPLRDEPFDPDAPLGPLDTPGAASYSGDQPGPDGSEQ